uniref:Uncharacterized protein n=1 Tax=Cacopsylla melanoneura TaxID=428564 RepID=A0A8D9BHF5_9HEMI
MWYLMFKLMAVRIRILFLKKRIPAARFQLPTVHQYTNWSNTSDIRLGQLSLSPQRTIFELNARSTFSSKFRYIFSSFFRVCVCQNLRNSLAFRVHIAIGVFFCEIHQNPRNLCRKKITQNLNYNTRTVHYSYF